jgi:hypothetical protein
MNSANKFDKSHIIVRRIVQRIIPEYTRARTDVSATQEFDWPVPGA